MTSVMISISNYLDLTFVIDIDNGFSTKLYDKRNNFNFHIVTCSVLSTNIPSGPSYTYDTGNFIVTLDVVIKF